MRGHDDGDTQLAAHPKEGVRESLLGHRVELRGRFIKQQKTRAQGQGRRQHDDLLLAARKLVAAAVEPRLNAKEVRDLGHAAAHLGLRNTPVFQAKGQLVPHGIADQLVGGALVDISYEARALKRALARPGRRQSGHRAAQKGRLAAAGGTHQQLKLARGHAPVDPREDGLLGAGIGECEALCADHRATHRRAHRFFHSNSSQTAIARGAAKNNTYGT